MRADRADVRQTEDDLTLILGTGGVTLILHSLCFLVDTPEGRVSN